MVILPLLKKRGQIEGFRSDNPSLIQQNLFSDQHSLSESEGESICSSVSGVGIYIWFGWKKRVNRWLCAWSSFIVDF